MELYRNEDGLSLIEILLGITLLVIVLTPMLGFFGNSANIIRQTDIKEKALSLAQERMEELKTVDYDDLEDEEENYLTITVNNYPEFERKVEINPGSTSNIKEIIVTVYWDSRNKNVRLKTLVARR